MRLNAKIHSDVEMQRFTVGQLADVCVSSVTSTCTMASHMVIATVAKKPPLDEPVDASKASHMTAVKDELLDGAAGRDPSRNFVLRDLIRYASTVDEDADATQQMKSARGLTLEKLKLVQLILQTVSYEFAFCAGHSQDI